MGAKRGTGGASSATGYLSERGRPVFALAQRERRPEGKKLVLVSENVAGMICPALLRKDEDYLMGRIKSLLTTQEGSRGPARVLLSPLTMLVVAAVIVLSLVAMLLSEHNFTNNAESATSTQSVTNDQGAGPSYTVTDLGTLGGEDASNPTCTPPPTSTASASASAAPCTAGGGSVAYGIN